MERVDRIAARMVEAWETRAPYAPLAGDLAPADLAEAYAAQAAAQALLVPKRGAIVGRKIALTSKAMQEMLNVDRPAFGGIYANDVHESPAAIPFGAFQRLGVEFELALELARDAAPDAPEWTADSVAGIVASVRPAFELIEDRAADYASLDFPTLVADNAWCGGVVFGAPIEDWRDRNIADLSSVVRQEGEPDESVNTGAADPLGSFAFVLNHFRERRLPLRAGEFVITGSAARTRFPDRGAWLCYDVAGLSSVEMTVV